MFRHTVKPSPFDILHARKTSKILKSLNKPGKRQIFSTRLNQLKHQKMDL